MANKSLNDSLDSHFNKVKTGIMSFKPKKQASSLWQKIKACCTKVKQYFFPPAQFEHTYIDDSGTTVVTKKSAGIFAHLELFKVKRQKKKEKQIKAKEDAQDIDMLKVSEVISKGKL